MKRIFAILFSCLFLSSLVMKAQEPIMFIANNLEGEDAEMVNESVSSLLTAFSEAIANDTILKLDNLDCLTAETKKNLATSWKNNAFRCPDPMIIESADPSKAHPDELEIRHIPLLMYGFEQGSWREYQEATIRVKKMGGKYQITSFNLSLDAAAYGSILSNALEEKEYGQLSIILDNLERFRNAYCIKDLDFLEKVYSDDALIITGNVVKTKKSNSDVSSKIVYKKYSKKEYIDHLKIVFKNNAHIDVTFDSITVKRHPMIEGIFGVQLYQGYKSTRYADEGYLFLLWDFRDEENPQIHIRTWQDVRLWDEEPETERYDIESFDISDF